MKKKLRSFLAIVLLLSTIAGILSSCRGKNEAPPDATEAEATTPEQTDEQPTAVEQTTNEPSVPSSLFELVKNGELPNVVLPQNPTAEDEAAKKWLTLAMRTQFGAEPNYITDDQDYNGKKVEILMGDTRYPETREARKNLAYGECGVFQVRNKVVIVGNFCNTLLPAAKAFGALVVNYKDKAGNVTIPQQYKKVETAIPVIPNVPTIEEKQPISLKYVGDDNKCFALMFEVNLNEYNAYVERLVAKEGFELYASNTINKNQFGIYTKEGIVLNTAFVPTMGRMTLTVETADSTVLPGKPEENVYTEIFQNTTLTQIGLWYDVDGNGNEVTPSQYGDYIHGLSHIIRLRDGSFIIIDGGNPRRSDAERIYNTLKKQAIDPEHIVIAAWIFTHAHTDHAGAFLHFKHFDDVTVERFIFNVPNDCEGAISKDGILSNVMKCLRTYYPDVAITTAHPGQVFYIRNATITMLNTFDLYCGEWTWYNETSLVFRLEVEDFSVMYLGDLGMTTNTYLCKMYENALKSDFVQVAHHGFEGADLNTYRLIKPSYVLWNTGCIEGKYEWMLTVNGNNYFTKNHPEIVKWVAGNTITVITLKKGVDPASVIYENVQDYFRS